MTSEDFVGLYRGYWPQARNVGAPNQAALWAEVIDGIPDEIVRLALKRYARAEDRSPSVVQFERAVWPVMDDWAQRHPEHMASRHWLERRRRFELADDERNGAAPIARPCATCKEDIRFDAPPGNRRFRTDGGLVFREFGGKWYAARCPQCGGPELHRPYVPAGHIVRQPSALPLPRTEDAENGVWRGIADLPEIAELQRLARASGVVRLTVDADHRVRAPFSDEWSEYFAWRRTAVQNTRAVIEGREPNPFTTEDSIVRRAYLEVTAKRAAAGTQLTLIPAAPPAGTPGTEAPSEGPPL